MAGGFAPVLIAPAGADATADNGTACAAEPAIEVAFASKVRVRIPGSVSAELVAAVVKVNRAGFPGGDLV